MGLDIIADISQLGSAFLKSSHVFLKKEKSIENWSQLQQHIFKNFSFAKNLKKIMISLNLLGNSDLRNVIFGT